MQQKAEYLRVDPAFRTRKTSAFWPPLLQSQWRVLPKVCHCVATFIVLSFQNADVERDLAILKKSSERAEGRLGMDRLDGRVRVALHLPRPAKGRMEPVRGTIRKIARLWSSQQRRQSAPGEHSKRGSQGKVPQRGQRSNASALEHKIKLDATTDLGTENAREGGTSDLEEVDISALLDGHLAA